MLEHYTKIEGKKTFSQRIFNAIAPESEKPTTALRKRLDKEKSDELGQSLLMGQEEESKLPSVRVS